jgi:hypothetical protein
MNPAKEFRRHADECFRIAKTTADLEERAGWTRMGERWLRCAEQAEQEDAAAQSMAAARKLKYRTQRVAGRRSEHAA